MRTIITDDEPIARELLQKYAQKIPWLDVVAVCANAVETQQALQQHPPDLLFLDIQMPDLTGLELLGLLKTQPLTILTTAYSEYALEGYSHNVVDYLLKPIEFDRFFKAVNKAAGFVQPQTSPPIEPKNHLYIKSDYKLQRINFDEILYIEAMEKYIRFHSTEGRYMTLMSMQEIEALLPEDTFFRIHRSYIVSMNKIGLIEGNRIEIAGQKLPISKGRKAAFIQRIS